MHIALAAVVRRSDAWALCCLRSTVHCFLLRRVRLFSVWLPLLCRYKAAALEQQGSDKSEPILLAASDGSPSAAVCVDDEPTPWASRAVFPVSHTSPFWRSVRPSLPTSTAGAVALSSLSKGVINTKHAPPPSVLPAGAVAGARPRRSRATRKAPRLWSGNETGEDGTERAGSIPSTTVARYGTDPWVSTESACAEASQTRPASALSSAAVQSGSTQVSALPATEKDLWADEITGVKDASEPTATTRTDAASRLETGSRTGAEDIVDAVAAAAAASGDDKEVLQESEAALNARVRALQLENAQLEEEFRRQSVVSETQQPS